MWPYSVHDLEDALHDGSLPLDALTDPAERDELLDLCQRRYVPAWSGIDRDVLIAALDRLLDLPLWPAGFDGGLQAHAQAKASPACSRKVLLGVPKPPRVRRSAGDASPGTPPTSWCRRGWGRVRCPQAVTARYVMERPGTERRYADERESGGRTGRCRGGGGSRHARSGACGVVRAGPDDAARLRVVIDKVAALTDTSAADLHRRLCRPDAPA